MSFEDCETVVTVETVRTPREQISGHNGGPNGATVVAQEHASPSSGSAIATHSRDGVTRGYAGRDVDVQETMEPVVTGHQVEHRSSADDGILAFRACGPGVDVATASTPFTQSLFLTGAPGAAREVSFGSGQRCRRRRHLGHIYRG